MQLNWIQPRSSTCCYSRCLCPEALQWSSLGLELGCSCWLRSWVLSWGSRWSWGSFELSSRESLRFHVTAGLTLVPFALQLWSWLKKAFNTQTDPTTTPRTSDTNPNNPSPSKPTPSHHQNQRLLTFKPDITESDHQNLTFIINYHQDKIQS